MRRKSMLKLTGRFLLNEIKFQPKSDLVAFSKYQDDAG